MTIPTPIGILGGTGPLGRGLAARWAQGGLPVLIGSRDPARARALADEVRGWLDGSGAEVTGLPNDAVVDAAGLLAVTVPFEAQAALLGPLAGRIGHRIVISTAVPLTMAAGTPTPQSVPEGSAALQVARLCPGARVTAAFHTVGAGHLRRLSHPLDQDVVVTGDDDEARQVTLELVERIRGARAVDGGALAAAVFTEHLTPFLLQLNRRHHARVGLRLAGLPPQEPAPPPA